MRSHKAFLLLQGYKYYCKLIRACNLVSELCKAQNICFCAVPSSVDFLFFNYEMHKATLLNCRMHKSSGVEINVGMSTH